MKLMKLCFFSVEAFYVLTIWAEWHRFGPFLAPNYCSDHDQKILNACEL